MNLHTSEWNVTAELEDVNLEGLSPGNNLRQSVAQTKKQTRSSVGLIPTAHASHPDPHKKKLGNRPLSTSAAV